MYILLLNLIVTVNGVRLPGSCKLGQFYEPSLMDCVNCPSNTSMTTSLNGFSCSCDDHSVPAGISRCRQCNVTEVISADGTMCVPRRCQSSAGKIVCRKCPNEYLTLSQNIDGSPMKEVQCVKCTRGYKPENNVCVRCEKCTCNKSEVVVAGRCVAKKYIADRPKYTENILHPSTLLEVIKLEYLCTEHDLLACRALANVCVRSFYTPNLAGPCRLWLKPETALLKGLPILGPNSHNNKNNGELVLNYDQDSITLGLGIHTSVGGFKFIKDAAKVPLTCFIPMKIKVGEDFQCTNIRNITGLSSSDYGDLFELYVVKDKNLLPLPITVYKPTGHPVQRGVWRSTEFRKFFLIDKSLSPVTNTTNTVYLWDLLLVIRVNRDVSNTGSLKLHLSIEANYKIKTPHVQTVETSFRVQHDMPKAGVLKGLEIWGSVLGVSLMLYGLVHWRSVLRRGGAYFTLMPIIAGTVADALYFATLLSTVYALAGEAGSLGLTLPLSSAEESVIRVMIFTVISLKALNIVWISWKQCRCEIYFIDWSCISTIKDQYLEHNIWKMRTLAKEWISLQTSRRVSPGFTVSVTVLVIHLLNPWVLNLPKSQGYKWAVSAIAWWCCYGILLLFQLIYARIFGCAADALRDTCSGAEISLLVFEEYLFAHYINGRNDEGMDLKMTSGALSSCRIVCSPQLRSVFNKLENTSYEGSVDSNKILLTRFIAAFFDRALDGLNWVASERTLLERLFDSEFADREGGSTSVLLYDSNTKTPSCIAVTWWGEECSFAIFDAMLFGAIYYTTNESLLAGAVALIVWQVMKHMRAWIIQTNLKR